MDTFTGRFGPREIALAVALGILIGLLPKANLLVVLLAILLFISHANFLVAIPVILLVSVIAPWIHPFCDRIGVFVLTSSGGQSWGGALSQIPLARWTMFDNTLVLGSLLLGLALFLPIFLLVWIPLKIIWPKKKKEEKKDEQSEEKAKQS